LNQVDEYIHSLDGEPRIRLEALRLYLSERFPDAEEVVRYGIPTLRIGGRNFLHYAAYVKHIGLYPGPATLSSMQAELSNYKHSKGAVQFAHEHPLPWPLIEAIALEAYRRATEK